MQHSMKEFAKKWVIPTFIYLSAIALVLLNMRLMFDGVLWGDEAFSVNTAEKPVRDILQVMKFWDCHPPLYYFWLRLFIQVFGNVGVVYHLASIVPYTVGIVFAITIFRKRFGNIPAMLWVIITSLASSCLLYNQEVRMYALAFICVAFCYYAGYRILCGSKWAWAWMVIWALFGAYSHYYALVTVGITMFITYVAAQIKYGGKTWVKGLVSLLAFGAGYAPWLPYLFGSTQTVAGNWWQTEILSLKEILPMAMGGEEFYPVILIALIAVTVLLLILFRFRIKTWSDEMYASMVGVLVVGATICAAYTLCLIIGPILAKRYLYPLSAVSFMALAMGVGALVKRLKGIAKEKNAKWATVFVKSVFALVLAVLIVIGFNNYRVFEAECHTEKTKTEATLALIGEPKEGTMMVSHGVKHLSWTVLYHYYPGYEIIEGAYDSDKVTSDAFWYFNPTAISDDEMKFVNSLGLTATCYGEQQISKYPFVLYYFERTK